MKKLILSISLILAFSAGTFAQKANVRRAENLSLQENPNFNEARNAIKDAFSDEKTKNDPRTYFTAGQIGFKENESYNTVMMLGRENEVNKDKKGEAIMESYKYFMQAYDYDQVPDKKGKVKPKFTKRIKDNILELYGQQYNMIAYGAHLFENRKYQQASDVFTTYLNVPSLPLFSKGELSTSDSTYLMIKYFNALALTNNKSHAEAVKAYESMKNDNYESLNVYQLLSEEYMHAQDSVGYLNTLKEGFDKFQDEPWFLQNIINFYINSERIAEASDYLNAAIAQNPNIAEYYFVKGNIEERLSNNNDAKAAFEKALALDPEMAGAYAGIGRIIFNKAVDMQNEANSIKDNKAFNEEMSRIKVVFEESLPYMEKAIELEGQNREFKQNLKMLYYRLGDEEKYDAITKELEG